MTSEEFNRLFPAKPANPAFEAWMSQVDKILIAATGIDSRDLPDFLYCDEYEDGATPKQAAKAAMRAARDF